MNRPWLLSVDDSLDDTLLLRHACKKLAAQFELTTASSGVEALECVRKAHAERGRGPDFVLLDLSMPAMTGLEVLEAMRENPATRDLRIAVFTSSENKSDIEAAYQRGANYYLSKPPDLGRFITLVECISQALAASLPHPWQCLEQFPTFKLRP